MKEGGGMEEDNQDPQSAGRGIVYGILLGGMFWLLVIGIWMIVR